MMFLVYTNEYSCFNSVALYWFGLCLLLRFRVRVRVLVRVWVMLNFVSYLFCYECGILSIATCVPFFRWTRL